MLRVGETAVRLNDWRAATTFSISFANGPAVRRLAPTLGNRGRIGLRPAHHELGDVFAFDRDDLEAHPCAVRHVHAVVVRDPHAVHEVEVLGIRGIEHFALRSVRGRIAERAPHSPELPGLRIQHDHPPVPVSVRHKRFTRRGIHVRVCCPVHILRVCVAATPVRAADLHDEFTVRGGFQELVVALAAPGDPDEAVVIHEDPVLGSRPLMAGPLPSPE